LAPFAGRRIDKSAEFAIGLRGERGEVNTRERPPTSPGARLALVQFLPALSEKVVFPKDLRHGSLCSLPSQFRRAESEFPIVRSPDSLPRNETFAGLELQHGPEVAGGRLRNHQFLVDDWASPAANLPIP
jgi:hypothetical protein